MQAERIVETPAGAVAVVSDGCGICALRFHAQGSGGAATPLLMQAELELKEYFAGRRKVFSVPLSIGGTPFQRQVWAALRQIPWGTAVSYGEIARRIGNPGASRAVGMANHRNPLPIFIPCHRVIAADGSAGGFGAGMDIKRILLKTEGIHVKI